MPRDAFPFLVASATVLSVGSAQQWQVHRQKNAYAGNGAHELPGLEEGRLGLSVEACEQTCVANPECSCVVYQSYGKKCWQRAACHPAHFINDVAFNVYVKQTENAVAGPTTTAGGWWVLNDAKTTTTIQAIVGWSPPKHDAATASIGSGSTPGGRCLPGYLQRPSNLVNVTMNVENVNYDWLMAFPALKKTFVTAIKTAIVDQAGDKTVPECIDIELSQGSVDVLAMVRPHSVHSEDVEEQLGEVGSGSANALALKLKAAPLQAAVSKNVDGVVSQTGVTTGDVRIKNVKVGSSADSPTNTGGGGGFSWAWLLWLLLLLLCCGACFAASLIVTQKKLIAGDIRDVPGKVRYMYHNMQSNRELVATTDPEDRSNGVARNDAPKAIRVHFLDQNGMRRIFCFKSQPLGMVISNSDTNTIQGFTQDSYAKEKGARVGWQVVQVQDKIVLPSAAPGEVRQLLDEESSILAPYVAKPSAPRDIKVHFVDGGGAPRVFRFKSSPLGIVMAKNDPSVVQGFAIGSYAKEKGVGVGWRVTQVASELVFAASCKQGDVETLISENSIGLDTWPLKMEFDTPDAETRTVLFREGPMGMAFFNKLPLCIEDFKTTSVAKEMGVQKGWVLTKIGDVDLRTETSFEKVAGYINEGIGQLESRDNAKNGVVLGRGNSHC